ncbi:Uncharacterised protein [Klebsiella pneumoniae]|nr:hypothetical protein Kpn23412_4048 [Klebsiella pneumoniae subsp. pneumoniae]KMI01706.1 hypothetical protein SM82_00062 [Klebsiella pneumoniae]OAA08322.1 hypothetical protein LT23_02074 [Klebsiella pneumoniae]SAR63447.1 Uncharacterised protein [Klebsiella pneumoniae]SVJ69691.1 Uncharacterised protein [Klebsiella pneumoniae]
MHCTAYGGRYSAQQPDSSRIFDVDNLAQFLQLISSLNLGQGHKCVDSR